MKRPQHAKWLKRAKRRNANRFREWVRCTWMRTKQDQRFTPRFDMNYATINGERVKLVFVGDTNGRARVLIG